jgi:hypothetical protein
LSWRRIVDRRDDNKTEKKRIGELREAQVLAGIKNLVVIPY